MNSLRVRIWVGLFIVSTVWGSTWLAIKLGLTSVPPFFGAGMRFALAAAVLAVVVVLRRIPIPLDADAKKLYLSLALLSYSIPFALVYWSQQFIPSGLSSIIFGAFPFWVAIFSHFSLADEKLNGFKLAGIALGFTGILIIFSEDVHLSDAMSMAGMSAVFLCTMLQAYSLMLIKRYGHPVSPFVMNLVGMTLGAVALLLLGLATESFESIVWDTAAIGSILYLSIVGSVLTFVTYHWLLKHIEAVYLSLTSFINPIVAVILGAFILDEVLAPAVFVGAVFVLGGLLVANGKYFYERIGART